MTDKNIIADEANISDEKLKSLARTLLPLIRAYLSSDEGRKDYAEWTAKKQPNNYDNDKKESY